MSEQQKTAEKITSVLTIKEFCDLIEAASKEGRLINSDKLEEHIVSIIEQYANQHTQITDEEIEENCAWEVNEKSTPNNRVHRAWIEGAKWMRNKLTGE